jgi:hypothetical protein
MHPRKEPPLRAPRPFESLPASAVQIGMFCIALALVIVSRGGSRLPFGADVSWAAVKEAAVQWQAGCLGAQCRRPVTCQ